MYNPVAAGGIDLVLIITNLFVAFFVGLVLYLRREDRREGYPLEDDVTGRLEPSGAFVFTATPKTFILPHDEGVLTVPNALRESQDVNGRRTGRAPGLPLQPNGDPLLAGIGPGSFAQRAKRPDMLLHGGTKIAPLRVCPGFSLDPRDPNPIGMSVVGADGVAGGVVSDAWIDRTEFLLRYLEIKLAGSGRSVLVPMPMVIVDKAKKAVRVKAVLGSQFATAPTLENPDQITFDEEERVAAYYGGGLLYATPTRTEPYL
jgi:photosynthetic reaction center H subunit